MSQQTESSEALPPPINPDDRLSSSPDTANASDNSSNPPSSLFSTHVRRRYREAAADAEASRRLRETLMKPSNKSSFRRPTRTESFTTSERIDRYFSAITPQKKSELDKYFASVIINDGVAFSLGSSSNWDGFWKCAFGGFWRSPFRDKISGKLLDESFKEKHNRVIEALTNITALAMSVDGFFDINSKSVFNLMAGAPLPFVIHSFSLQGKKESAANLDEKISTSIRSACTKLNVTKKVFGFCSDSPNVMKATRMLLCGERDGSSACVMFAYGCLCHALSNFIKDVCKEPFVKDIVTKTIQFAQLFRNTHVANDLLSKARDKLDKPPPTIKSFSTTRCVAVLCQSVLANKDVIGSVFTSQKMLDPSVRDLDLKPSSKATRVTIFAPEGSFWTGLELITPFFKFVNCLVTFFESDTAPISYALLSFALIFESLDQFDLPTGVTDGAKKSLKSRFNTIECDLHALAVILEPLVQKSGLIALQCFYEKYELNSAAMRAFEKGCDWLEMSADHRSKASSSFQMLLADLRTVMKRCGKQASAYHPQLWWSTDSTVDSIEVSNIAQAMFLVFLSGGGNKRSFKARSKVHTKTRNRLGDEKSDKQSFIVYNSGQLKRFNTALSSPQSSALEHCLVNGLFGEKGKDLLRIVGLTDFDEDYFDATKDICNVLIDVTNLQEEFEALLKVHDD